VPDLPDEPPTAPNLVALPADTIEDLHRLLAYESARADSYRARLELARQRIAAWKAIALGRGQRIHTLIAMVRDLRTEWGVR
jgi:hypothetical protein